MFRAAERQSGQDDRVARPWLLLSHDVHDRDFGGLPGDSAELGHRRPHLELRARLALALAPQRRLHVSRQRGDESKFRLAL